MATTGQFVNLIILGALALQAIVGIGLLIGGFARAASRGWTASMERTPDGRVPFTRKLMIGGAALMLLAFVEFLLIVLLGFFGFWRWGLGF